MKYVRDIIPWDVVNISLRPFKGFFSFNPSIHFDGETWRCVMRNCDYNAKGGAYNVKNGRIITRNAMVIFDPETWKPVSSVEMHEIDKLQRFPSSHYGYEDMRLFRVGSKLMGIATTAQLRTEAKQESIICHLDEDYNIWKVEPIRGGWSTIAQKNWTPYDGTSLPTFLYSIDGELILKSGDLENQSEDYVRDIIVESTPIWKAEPLVMPRGGTETRMLGRQNVISNRGFDWTPNGLRGGTQLVKVGPKHNDEWLAMGHEMKMVHGSKNYWHTWFSVDSKGKRIAKSEPFKLTDVGIEFAAGIGIDGDKVVVSYGTEDMDSWLGFSKLSAVMETLIPCKV